RRAVRRSRPSRSRIPVEYHALRQFFHPTVMLPRKTRRQTELRQPIRLAHEEPKPVIGAMDILASLAMTNECVKGVARRCSAAMDGKASVAGIESQGEVVGPSIEPSAPGDILHSLVKLLNRVAID